MGSDDGARWYTVDADADLETVVAAYRGALIAQRPRLSHVDIDLVSDRPWPADVHWAVDAAALIGTRRRWLRWLTRRSITLRVDPADEAGFAIAVALAPFTIGGTGLDQRARIVWSGNDTGTSAAFMLTEDELIATTAAITADGGDPQRMVQLA